MNFPIFGFGVNPNFCSYDTCGCIFIYYIYNYNLSVLKNISFRVSPGEQ